MCECSMVYNMCNQREPYNWSQQLYDKYTQVLQQYLNQMAKPKLDEARKGHEMGLLKEVHFTPFPMNELIAD